MGLFEELRGQVLDLIILILMFSDRIYFLNDPLIRLCSPPLSSHFREVDLGGFYLTGCCSTILHLVTL